MQSSNLKTQKTQALKVKQKAEELTQRLLLANAKNLYEFFTIISCYEQFQPKPKKFKAKKIWQKGSVSLYDFGGDDKDWVFLVPPLLNRSYIFDLNEDNSFINYLKRNGVRVFLIDWQEPIKNELHYGIEDYVVILLTALDKIILLNIKNKNHPAKLSVIGYCMGGLLSLALTRLAKSSIDSLALLATPWDFHSNFFPRINLDNNYQEKLINMMDKMEKVPADFIQSLFYYLHPFQVQQKFARFLKLHKDSAEYRDFIDIEQWANDGLALTNKVAKTCFIDWVQENSTAKNKWQVNGVPIIPTDINKKIRKLIVVPQNDRIVPKCSVAPLIAAMPEAKIIKPPAGHVTMLVGKNAEKSFMSPFLKWLKN